jgi:cobalt-zinc-cadmium efflux system protein
VRHEPGAEVEVEVEVGAYNPRPVRRLVRNNGETMSHDHPASAGRSRLGIALGISAAVLVAEFVGAIVTGSLALLVDAAHVLTDAGGLAIALTAASLVGRPANAKRTFGFGRAEVLGATAQAAILLAVGIFVLVEAVQRLFDPPHIAGGPLLLFGVIGLLGNVASIAVLASGRKSNLNMRAAFLDVLGDALGSIGVIAAAIVITLTGFELADAIAAILIGALILPRAFLLLKETTSVLLESTPKGLDLDSVRDHLLRLDHVQAVHDLHVSQIATGLPVLTAHVVVDDSCFYDGHAPKMLDELQDCVAKHFDVQIDHSTFQLELAEHGAHEHPTHD